jgi:hypothetical protein
MRRFDAWRRQRGGAALLICTLLVGASVLLNITLHRLAVHREQSWNMHRTRLQMQALGHGGLMWVMARLEDSRPIDERCRALPMTTSDSTTSLSFAQRWAQPGTHLRCQVMLDVASLNEASWQCNCLSDGAIGPPSGHADAATLDMQFDALEDGLLLGIRAQSPISMQPHVHRWTESVRLRRDGNGQWRAVVGTWMDSR